MNTSPYVYLCDKHFRRTMVEYTHYPAFDICCVCGEQAKHMMDIKEVIYSLNRLIDRFEPVLDVQK